MDRGLEPTRFHPDLVPADVQAVEAVHALGVRLGLDGRAAIDVLGHNRRVRYRRGGRIRNFACDARAHFLRESIRREQSKQSDCQKLTSHDLQYWAGVAPKSSSERLLGARNTFATGSNVNGDKQLGA